jgi:hypothetical protein
MATKNRNSSNLNTVVNADGYSQAGGSTNERKMTISAGDISFVGSGNATLTFPSVDDNIVGRKEDQSLLFASNGGSV